VSARLEHVLRILLITDQQYLIKLCNRALENLICASDVQFLVGKPDQLDEPAEIVIYDFTCVSSRVQQLTCIRQQDIFLVEREQVGSVRDLLLSTMPFLLLKPVAEGTLRLLIEQAINRCGWQEHDRQCLLQLTLESMLKLQEYDQDRRNFLARGIHDFRAPLTALKGYCGLLVDRQLGLLDPYQAEILRRMQHSINRLSKMADGMLQLSVHDRLDLELDLQETDLSACVAHSSSELTASLDEKQIQLTVELQTSPEELFCDASRIEQVLVNILDNACKFTPRYGSIDIRGYPFFWERRRAMTASITPPPERRSTCIRTPNAYRIDIRDSGPLIPLHQLPKIFEEYTSFSGGADRSGVGLGLAICKLIISQHRGSIWAESSDDRTTFSFVLPFAGKRAWQGQQSAAFGTVISSSYVDQLSIPVP
jgi:signal transduction histidine kinase